ncbi:efflux RND transporter periplasmic adaptor subunit [Consotaella salsifontis]|uniref:RND family efflux transporter, MFP subunit n=1 Tax=Consotaella salsifontis TaxID=1365950 RepID=A0A1T4NQ37_9HYPH|nr:efflux RND transporter periplasmic adaptor subunit [Consotaella salsifontis]SJZ81323.1 RND family efflux transporter, MFP subunit [Consotaella salsifontis]
MTDPVTTPPEETRPPVRERRSHAGWIAAVFVVALAAWMGSGYYWPAETPKAPHERSRPIMSVETVSSKARPVTQYVASEGEARPDRTTPVRVRAAGTVESVEVKKGDRLQEGALIAKIDLEDRAAQLAQAEATLAARQRDLDAAERLSKTGYGTNQQLTDARAGLAAAEASLAAIRQTTGNTEVRAPIKGVLDSFDLDIGEVVTADTEAGKILDIDTLVVEIQVPQQSIAQIKTGKSAEVSFITGQTRQGTVRYVAANASSTTRTFSVEIAVPNPDHDIPSGISASVRIPVGEVPAHFVSAALLALDTEGTLGIKAVGPEDKVAFYPVQLVKAETKGLWVSGLPDEVNLISVGQGFVSAGETVHPVPAGKSTEPVPADTSGQIASPAGVGADTGTDRASSTLMAPAPASDSATKGETQGSAPEPEGAATAGALADLANGAPDQVGVRLLQERLSALGFDPGPIDGELGEATRSAIRQFEQAHDLKVTGEVTLGLLAALVKAATAGQ